MAKMEPIVALTGANGYLGSCCARHFRSAGWRVRSLTRGSRHTDDAVDFRLGEPVSRGTLEGVDALVHCAYDFALTKRDEIARTNIQGSAELFSAARAAGVAKLVYVSSISAFDGCRSLYGQAKLQIETHARAHAAFVLRPGLIFGDPPGGTFGRLVDQVSRSRIVPLIGDGSQLQFLVHHDDLATFIVRCCVGEVPAVDMPITVAHPQAWPFRELLLCIGRQIRKQPVLVPTPWRLIWGGLKVAEALRLPLKFRSDSVVSLVNQNASPDFTVAQALGLTCRRFP